MTQLLERPEILVKEALHDLERYDPRTDLGRSIKRLAMALPRDLPFAAEMRADALEKISRMVVLESALSLVAFRKIDGPEHFHHSHIFEFTTDARRAVCWRCNAVFEIEDYGVVGRKVITTAGVNFLVDAWQNSVELEILKYHGLGTGSTAEAIGDTALVTELTTEYTGNVRATGSLTEGASANIFRTVGTNTLDGTPGAALREHGIFSADAAGTLWDRTVYAAITLSSGEALQATYDMTASSGG